MSDSLGGDGGGPRLVNGEERRSSSRAPMRLRVRQADTRDPLESREGNISLGGFAWIGGAMAVGTRVEARFVLPDLGEEMVVKGEVLHVGHGGRGTSSHVRFLDLSVESELRIARYLDDVERAASSNTRG